jgi:hypothetical protein
MEGDLSEDSYWISARNEQEAKSKASTRFGVPIDNITLKRG